MKDIDRSLFGLSASEQDALFSGLADSYGIRGRDSSEAYVPEDKYLRFEDFPALKQLRVEQAFARKVGILNPFFRCHEGLAKATTRIDGQEYLNFSTYDYLDLNGHPAILQAVDGAVRKWGTSAGASRLVSGERPGHRELEKKLAHHYGCEDAVIFVSGHATNVSVIGKLFGSEDIIFHDALSHNSIVLGACTSGAKRISYPHNDCAALRRLMQTYRPGAKRCLIVTEGVFSMDGNIADLPGLVALKKEFGAFLMVDEAHALGVLGATGHGTAEHFDMDPKAVDIWMGTLSKTCCGCGGYIAGCADLIELLKFTSPGFVYSVGMSPALAAASSKALDLMYQEPQRVQKLQAVSKEFVRYAHCLGLDTGLAQGYAVVPIMLGSSMTAGRVAANLFASFVNVMPIIYPVVEEGAARLRFFLSAAHSVEHLHQALDLTAQALSRIKKMDSDD